MNTNQNTPLVFIFSEYNLLSLKILQLFQQSYCRVKIFCKRKDPWIGNIENDDLNTLRANFINESLIAEKPNYVLSIDGFSKTSRVGFFQKISEVSLLIKKCGCKGLFVFPYFRDEEFAKDSQSVCKKITEDKDLFGGVLFMADIWTGRDFLIKGSRVKEIILSTLKKISISLPKDDFYLYVIRKDAAAETIVRKLFSLSPYGKKTAIISKPLSIGKFFRILRTYNLDIKIDYTSYLHKTEPEVDEKKYVSLKTDEIVKEAITFYRDVEEKLVGKPRLEFQRVGKLSQVVLTKFRRVRKKILFGALITGLVFTLLPLILVFISFTFIFIAKKAFSVDELNISRTFINLSKPSSLLAKETSSYLSYLPGVGKIYKNTQRVSESFYRLSNAVEVFLDFSDGLTKLANYVVANGEYNPDYLVKDLNFNLDELDKELGFLQSDLSLAPNSVKALVKKQILGNEVAEIRVKVVSIKNIASELPDILGLDSEKEKNYLVLLQNNLMLRPTGGEVSAFAFLKLQKGRLIGQEYFSSNSFDSQIKGEVLPPEPIKMFLNKKYWELKDVGWDPDFSISGAKAEWFIDKSLDKNLDGVVGVDLEFLGYILKDTNQKDIQKLPKNFSVNYLYDLLPEERRNLNDFSQLMENAFKGSFYPNDKLRLALLKDIFSALEGKNVQVFSHNIKIQRALSELSWDGGVRTPECGSNCYPDFVGLIESSFSDRPFGEIKREAKIQINFEENIIKRKLTFYLENPVQKESGNNYKTYIRVVAKGDVGFSPVEIIGNNEAKKVEPLIYGFRGFKEAGVFLEIPQGEAVAILFSWESGLDFNLSKLNQYKLIFRKQAGAEAYPIDVEALGLDVSGFDSDTEFSLTQTGEYRYNTSLSKDFSLNLFRISYE